MEVVRGFGWRFFWLGKCDDLAPVVSAEQAIDIGQGDFSIEGVFEGIFYPGCFWYSA